MTFNRIKIKAELIKRSLYQYEFAQKLGVSEAHLSKVLSGREKPSKELTKKIEATLKGQVSG